MSSRVLSGLLGAAVAAVTTFVAPVAHGQLPPWQMYTDAFTRDYSHSGSAAFTNSFSDFTSFTIPNIGQPRSAAAAAAASSIPWLPGQSQAQTQGDTSSPVHPTMRHSIPDALTSGILQGMGYGPWGFGGGYGGFLTWTRSQGRVFCVPRPGFVTPTRRIITVYVAAVKTSNVNLFGTTGIAGFGGLPPVAVVWTDALRVQIEPTPQGTLRLWSQVEGGAPTLLSEGAIVNNVLSVDAPVCSGGWFIDSRSGTNVYQMQPTPFSQGGAIVVATGWQNVKADGPPRAGLRNIFNPGPADLEGAPPLNLPDFSKITGMSGGSGGSSGGGSGGSSGGGSGGSSGSSSGSGSGSVPPPGI